MSAVDVSLTNEAIGERLRALRHNAGFTCGELAERATPYLADATQARQGELTRQAIVRIESGRRVLKFSEAVALSRSMDVGLAAFASEAGLEGALYRMNSAA